MNRAARPAGLAADPARLEPDESVLDDWLADDEFDQAAEHLRRLGGDAELLLNLQLDGFAAAVWEPVAQELARYGHAVLCSWTRRRLIFGKVKHRTSYGLPLLDGWPDDETAADIATETVVAALNYFRDKVLQPG